MIDCIELYRIVDWKVYRLTFQSLDLDENWVEISPQSSQGDNGVDSKEDPAVKSWSISSRKGVMVVKKDYQAGFHRDFITISSY